MIEHLVLFRLRPGVAADDPRIGQVLEQMAALPAAIAQIRGWQQGRNLTADAQAWDYALRARFDSLPDLHAYFDHPAHRPVLEQWDAIAELAFADLELAT